MFQSGIRRIQKVWKFRWTCWRTSRDRFSSVLFKWANFGSFKDILSNICSRKTILEVWKIFCKIFVQVWQFWKIFFSSNTHTQVFYILVTNPDKSPAMTEILVTFGSLFSTCVFLKDISINLQVRNKTNLVELLSSFLPEREAEGHFLEERQFIVNCIKQL